jgi:hypothetical protein
MKKRRYSDKIVERKGHERYLQSINRPPYKLNPYATQSILGRHIIVAPESLTLFNEAGRRAVYSLLRQVLEVPANSKVLLDLSEVREFKISAILILYAHLEVLIGSKLAARIIWKKPREAAVESKLAELGFWTLLGEEYNSSVGSIRICSVSYEQKETDQKKPLRDAIIYARNAIESHRSNSSEEAGEIAFGAISESFGNVWQHAYAQDLKKNYPTLHNLPLVKKWWIALEEIDKQLFMVVYDIGVGIPASTKSKSWYSALKSSLSFFSNLNSDCQDIRTALSYGGSRFKEQGRGNGLPTIKKLVDTNPDGWLHIMSGSGMYIYKSQSDEEQWVNLNTLFPGTMIQWNIALEQNGELER